ncbi:MAG: chemotaxis protein CheB [Spirochaetales bacterium]|nr:chemotaxis protein CheB [Spirochaetales bacterium]
MKKIRAVVIGTSAGGLNALSRIIPELDKDFPAPLILVQHMSPDGSNYTVSLLDRQSELTVKEADEKEIPKAGTIYVAPPNYHLLVERDGTLELSVDPRINYSRPSIDVLFETAAEAWGEELLGIVLTGANSDGSKGAEKILAMGGRVLVQAPETADAAAMPEAAIKRCKKAEVIPLEEIALWLNINCKKRNI